MSFDDKKRRSVLAAGATALAGGLAGCMGLLTGEDSVDIDLPVEGEAKPIHYGDEKTGELTLDSPSEHDFGHYDPWAFEGSAGDRVTVSMTSDTGDTLLYLINEKGQLLAQNDDNGAGLLNSSIPAFELPEDGAYAILASSFDNTTGFEYELSLDEGVVGEKIDLREIAVGETKTGKLDIEDPQSSQYDGYYEPVTLQVETDQYVTIEMTAGSGDTYLYLLDEGGSLVARNDDNGAGMLNSTIERVSVQGGTEYTIVAASFAEGVSFEYQLSVTGN